jgi:hypothetical protein
MSNLTALPPPQLSSDGRWRWDGQQWVPAGPKSSKRPGSADPGAPQLSSDGRWWWTGYQWAPAEQASSKQPQPPGPGALPKSAVGFGAFALAALPLWLIGIDDMRSGSYQPGWADVSAALAVTLPGTVFGVLALALPGHGHDRSERRHLAWAGMAASLISTAVLCLILLA